MHVSMSIMPLGTVDDDVRCLDLWRLVYNSINEQNDLTMSEVSRQQ